MVVVASEPRCAFGKLVKLFAEWFESSVHNLHCSANTKLSVACAVGALRHTQFSDASERYLMLALLC